MSNKVKISQIINCNLYIYMTYTTIRSHIWLIVFRLLLPLSMQQKIRKIITVYYVYEFFCHTYPHLTDHIFSFVKTIEITGGTASKMWLEKYARNFLTSIKTGWCDNLPGTGHELANTGVGHKLVETFHIDNLCWFLKPWYFVLVNDVSFKVAT